MMSRPFVPRPERTRAGEELRREVPHAVHARWSPPHDRADPIALLRASDPERIPSLVPLRYERMIESPFVFYRGNAAIMAADLATGPSTGITVQLCGDAHLLNFGSFATPERNL